jgi:hypothetical protein
VHGRRLLLQARQQPLEVAQEQVGGVVGEAPPDHHPERRQVGAVLGKV